MRPELPFASCSMFENRRRIRKHQSKQPVVIGEGVPPLTAVPPIGSWGQLMTPKKRRRASRWAAYSSDMS